MDYFISNLLYLFHYHISLRKKYTLDQVMQLIKLEERQKKKGGPFPLPFLRPGYE